MSLTTTQIQKSSNLSPSHTIVHATYSSTLPPFLYCLAHFEVAHTFSHAFRHQAIQTSYIPSSTSFRAILLVGRRKRDAYKRFYAGSEKESREMYFDDGASGQNDYVLSFLADVLRMFQNIH